MKSNQQQQSQNFPTLSPSMEQSSDKHPGKQSFLTPLGSLPLPTLPNISPSILQANPQLNPNQLQQLFQQQNLKQQELQHQLIEEQLLQQSQLQKNTNNEDLLPQSHSQQPDYFHSSAPYETNLQNQQHNKQTENNDPRDSQPNILSSNNYMPGTASLIEYIDKQLIIILRDGKKFIGFLRSIDQYANLLLSNTFERIHVNNKYADIQRGIFIIRGENVVLLGEVDLNMLVKVSMERVTEEEILALQNIEQKKQEEAEKAKKKALVERCLIPNSDNMFDEYY